jgi:amidohydrolase
MKPIEDQLLKRTELDYLWQIRKTLHSIAELSGKEKQTAIRIIEFLKNCYPDELLTEVGGLGIIATWNSLRKGPEILLRADMDALPVIEQNQFDYKSKNRGVSHQCGHDGHVAILLGVAMILAECKPEKGKIHLLFQPSEENGEGAESMLRDKKMTGINPDYVFALHNIPGYPMHSVILKEGNFTAATTSIIISLKGKTSHAAEPEHGINPALALAEMIQQAVALENNEPESDDMQLITPIFASLGEKAYGTSAGEATVHFTLRCRNECKLELLKRKIEAIASDISANHELRLSFDYTQTFIATENDAGCVKLVRETAENLGLEVIEKQHPFKWGEDFGVFATKFKGCMVGMGAGEHCPALHSPDYDFPDELIQTGTTLFHGIISKILQ